MNYTINTGFEDGTTIKVETSNRKLFFRIEEIINNFQFTNEEPNGIEQQDNFQNELDLNDGIEKTQNDGNEERGIELDKIRGNEENQNKSQKTRGNELNNSKKHKKQDTTPTNRLPPINTKYGRAYHDKGYYIIRDKTSKYNNQPLHKVIYEEYYHCTILKGNQIHHLDGNKSNNKIDNLKLMTKSEHTILHNKQKGFAIPERTLNHNVNISKSQNNTGYFRVSKSKANNKQGFVYKYQYYEDGIQKSINSIKIRKLERKVKRKGLPWKKL